MKSAVIAATAALIVAAVTPSSVYADSYDKKTTLTVNELILIPGRTLQPGKYVMKLASSSSNRHIVQIFNESDNKLQATMMAINNYRINPSDKTELSYWETPEGVPPALRSWFYPGDNYGQEFAYPKKLADEIARNNANAKVPSYADNVQVGVNTKPETVTLDYDAAATQAPPQSQTRTVVAAPAPARTPTEPTLIAQADTRRNVEIAQAAPQPRQPLNELPQTASPLGIAFMAALLCLMGALVLRTARKRPHLQVVWRSPSPVGTMHLRRQVWRR